ncbi:MAG: RNB domain-containing ribonuclease, partial [Thermodesulfobacteriota bacterium]
ELESLAKHCTEEEDAAKKVERQVTKSAAAILLESRIGEQFDAIVTGASDKGTWVRLLHPPIAALGYALGVLSTWKPLGRDTERKAKYERFLTGNAV